MAEDCRISTDFLRHPKTRKLKRRVNTDGVLALVALWLFAADAKSDGDLNGMSDEEVELAADWTGEPGALIHALVETRFLDGTTGAYVIHNWAKRNPFAAARGLRIEAARKAAIAKWDKRKSTDAKGIPSAFVLNAERIPEGSSTDAVCIGYEQDRIPPTHPRIVPNPQVNNVVTTMPVPASPLPPDEGRGLIQEHLPGSLVSAVETGVHHVEHTGSNCSCAAAGEGKSDPLVLSAKDLDWAEIQRVRPTSAQVDAIYKLYPKKLAPIHAKKAIRQSVRLVMRGDADHSAMSLADALKYLGQRLRLYAQRVQGSDRQLIPYPATWFNAGRFWDDPENWKVETIGKKTNGIHHNGDESRYTEGADFVHDNNIE